MAAASKAAQFGVDAQRLPRDPSSLPLPPQKALILIQKMNFALCCCCFFFRFHVCVCAQCGPQNQAGVAGAASHAHLEAFVLQLRSITVAQLKHDYIPKRLSEMFFFSFLIYSV